MPPNKVLQAPCLGPADNDRWELLKSGASLFLELSDLRITAASPPNLLGYTVTTNSVIIPSMQSLRIS